MAVTTGELGGTPELRASLSNSGSLHGQLTGLGAIDVYTKAEILAIFAQKGMTLADYGITDAYTKDQIDATVAQITAGIEYHVVSALPTTGEAGGLYFVPSSSNPSAYDEYIYADSRWILVNEIAIDSTHYMPRTEAYTRLETDQAIANALNSMTSIQFAIVDALPATGTNGTFYLVPNGSTGDNGYTEYVYVNSRWEKVGAADINLSNYLTTDDVVAATTSQIDAILDT